MKTGKHALLFDMDGVIINSSPLRQKATELYLNRLGITVDTPSEPMEGWTNEHIFKALFKDDTLSDEEVQLHSDRANHIFYELAGPRVDRHLVPGIVDFLNRWKALPTALASNSEQEAIDFILTGAGLWSYFDTVVCPGHTVRPKPFPDVYLAAAARLGVAPDSCIVFEDSKPGIEAALAASMHVVAVQPTPIGNPQGVALSIHDFTCPDLDIYLNAFLHPA